ncbi:hypothetical protein LSH36_321g03019 [Paralvinella palmiformis]|uniref:G-protein coupled receptors family 1 profile domain-containing protein n=1 Tax=Paralvinella palmiformis TaxID=53620 RepID=A0AAD9JGE7_9ANNE|nr:hypothetical protein LSH36_321g03019 [Paralvinella palmiformis]
MAEELQFFRCRACASFLHSVIDNFTLTPDGSTLASPGYNCSDHLWRIFSTNLESTNASEADMSSQPPYAWIEDILYSKVIVAMCFIGLFGNMLNLILLLHRELKHISGRMEKFAYSGLLALALSNMLFCLTTIPYGFVEDNDIWTYFSFDLVFHTYNNAIINIFILASTWLTVTLAIGRYMAVCHPLHARAFLGMTCARRSIIAVFFVCVLINIPRFFTYDIVSAQCLDGSTIYLKYNGYMKLNETFYLTFNWSYFVFGVVVPLAVLAFCNSYLIYALRMSRQTQNRIRATKVKETSNKTTLILIVIIVMYIVLVSPAEIINFIRQKVLTDRDLTDVYNLAVAVVNSLQALNFAFDFIPYCAINANLWTVIKTIWPKKKIYKRNSSYSDFYYKYPSKTDMIITGSTDRQGQ